MSNTTTIHNFDRYYTTTLNRASQATIPKAIQNVLGLKLGDTIRFQENPKTKTVTISKEPSLEEKLDAFRANLSPETKAHVAKISKYTSKKSISELMSDWRNSPEGLNYYEEKYGVENV